MASPAPAKTNEELPSPKRGPTQLSTRQAGIIARLDHGDVVRPEDLAAFATAHGHAISQRAGRLVYEIEEARAEYGDEIASRLKTDPDNGTILWPQPHQRDGAPDPADPQNWSARRKTICLIVASLAAIVPDFSSGLGIASLFSLAAAFKTTPNEINNLTSNWSIFCLGPGGVIAVWLCRRYGRLPVLWWSMIFSLFFNVGCAASQTLNGFAACRILAALFGTAPQVTGLYVISDLYPAHKVARKISIWTASFVISPFLSPCLGGYIVTVATFREVYAFGIAYNAVVVIAITLFMHETMFDRYLRPIPIADYSGVGGRIKALVGLTALKMAKHRVSLGRAILDTFDTLWRPQALLTFIIVASSFGMGIGVNVTAPQFLAEPPRLFSPTIIASFYWTPIVAVLIGEALARLVGKSLVKRLVHRNHGVFEAEQELWSLWIWMPWVVGGLTLFGASFSNDLSPAAIVFGWGIAEVGIVGTTIAGYGYLAACFPERRGEVSALLNWARVIVGFAVPYFQTTSAEKHGPVWIFGLESGVVAATYVCLLPVLQILGKTLRDKYSIVDRVPDVDYTDESSATEKQSAQHYEAS